MPHLTPIPPSSLSALQFGYCAPPIDWLTYSMLALTIGITLYSLIYMIGSLVSRPQVKGLARAGIGDVFSVFIFLMFILIIKEAFCLATPTSLGLDFSGLGNVAQLMSVGANPNNTPILALSEAYLKLLYYEGERLYKMLLVQLLYTGAVTSTTVNAGSIMGDLHPFGGLEPLLNFAPYLLSSLTILLMSVSVQFYMLKFFEATGLSLFLPLGILMRVIPPTRGFGGALIAIAISMYLVYPLLLSYNFYVLVNNVKIDDVQINSYLYNTPTCEKNDDCASNECKPVDPNNPSRKFCTPCVLVGEPPNGDSSKCCYISKFEDNKCEIKDEYEEKPELLGNRSGGIIAKGATPASYGVTMFVGTMATLGALSVVLSGVGTILPKVGQVTSVLSGLIASVVSIASVFISITHISFIAHPLFAFIITLLLNGDFFFVGFILPVVEFIVMIEFIRTLSSSMGEPVDLIQVFRVI